MTAEEIKKETPRQRPTGHLFHGERNMTKVGKQEDIKGDDLNELAGRFIDELYEEGVVIDTINEENTGLGDSIERALSKVGVTSEKIEKIFGVGGCECGARKKFLNKLFPFFRKGQVNLSEEQKERLQEEEELHQQYLLDKARAIAYEEQLQKKEEQ
jgi:hypothetical protein